MTRLRIAALVGAALLVVPAAASAQSSAKPAPCPGIEAVEDSPTDARVGFAGVYTPAAADANQEITNFFWRNELKGSQRVLTANLVIKNMTDDAAPGSLGNVYRFFYTTADGMSRYIEYGYSVIFGPSFSKGRFDPSITYEGPATGKVFYGADGVIQIEVARGAEAAKPLTGVRWNATTDRGAVIAQSDVVPNGSERLTYEGQQCTPPAPAA